MSTKDTRPYIVVAHEFPRHPKTQQLSDAGFRALIELWCYCNEYLTDGAVPKVLVDRQYKKPARELLALGFMEADGDGYRMHDYLKHQKSRAEVEEDREKKRSSGARGGKEGSHKRWHVDRGIFAEDCELCTGAISEPMSGT